MKTPEYLSYKSEAPKLLRWIMSTNAGAFLFFGCAIGLGLLIGWALA